MVMTVAEYIERTEELILAVNAGARAIENTKRYHGTVYTKDVFSESPQEIPYLQAAKVLREVSDAPAADVAPVVHWVLTDEKLPPDGQDVLCWYEYFRYGAFNRMYQTYGIGFQFNGNWGGEVANGRSAKVLAWMPLPEPPKMDGGDNGDAD
jgi:hypothetical protein